MTGYYILLSFFVYGFLGWCTEVAYAALKERKFVNRGFLSGPICPIYGVGVIVVVTILEPVSGQLALLYAASAVLTTVLEWLTGFLLEKLFHHKWWYYSNMPFNLNGYVCLLFSLMWGAACVVIVRWIYPFTLKIIKFLPVWAGISILIILGILFAVDLYVTVSGILKLNRFLDRMEKIAKELQNVSDQIGSNISKNVLEGIEKQEEAAAKAEELKEKYLELLKSHSKITLRIFKAFPRMRPLRHERQFQDLKEYFLKKSQEEKKGRLEE